MEKQNTSLCVCISIHVHAVPVLLHFVIVLCLCECAEEGREKTRKEHLPLILCLAHFPCLTLNVGVIGKEEVIIVDCTQAGYPVCIYEG